MESKHDSAIDWLLAEIIDYNYALFVNNDKFVLNIPLKELRKKCEEAKALETKIVDDRVRKAMVMVVRSMSDLPFAKGDEPE